MKNKPNNIPILQNEGYDLRKPGLIKLHKSEQLFWERDAVSLIASVFFVAIDAVVMFSLLDYCYTQSAFLGFLYTIGCAVILDFLPLITARFVHHLLYKTHKYALPIVIGTAAAIVMVFLFTLNLRFAYVDMYETDTQITQLQNTAMNTETISEIVDEDSQNKSWAAVLLAGFLPLGTSIASFAIAYANDPLKKEIRQLEIRSIEIDEAISDIEAAISVLETDREKDIELDKLAMETEIESVRKRANTLKAFARHYLAEYAGTATAASRLSQEMLIVNDASAEVADGHNKMTPNILHSSNNAENYKKNSELIA